MLSITIEGNYKLTSSNCYVMSVVDADGNAVVKNDDYTYTLGVGTYTLTLTNMSIFDTQAGEAYEFSAIDPSNENVEIIPVDVREDFAGEHTLGDFSIYCYDYNDGIYYMVAYSSLKVFNLYYTYTLTENEDGSYRVIPVFYPDHDSNTHDSDVLGLESATVTAVLDNGAYVITVEGVDVESVPDSGIAAPGTEENPILIMGEGEVMISANAETPLYIKVGAGFTVAIDCAAYFSLGDGSLGKTVTATETTVYMIYAENKAGCTGRVYSSAESGNEGGWVVTSELSEGDNYIKFTSAEISSDVASRKLTITKSMNYKFKSSSICVEYIFDANGNEIVRNSDFTYTLEAGEYTVYFGKFSNFGVLANQAYAVTVSA